MNETLIGESSHGNGADNARLISDSDQARFVADVIEASKTVPILVDFWAPWCGPCKQLGPAIERAVKQAGGAVRLVKINVDENQAIAQQMRIQSIPAVYAFYNGQPVDGFMGAKPEGEIKAFIQALIDKTGSSASPLDAVIEQAEELLANGDHKTAGQIFAEVLAQDRENIRAIAGMARCQLDAGDVDAARVTLSLVPPSKENEEAIVSVKAAIELAGAPSDAGEIEKLQKAVAADEKDYQARFDLATALNAAGRRQEAIDELLTLIKLDRNWNDEAARKQVLTFFEAWGQTDPDTVAGRRKLSTVLFS